MNYNLYYQLNELNKQLSDDNNSNILNIYELISNLIKNFNINININITPLLVLILIDILGINMLWNERYERRILHHIQNNNYNCHKKPIIYKINGMLNNELVSKVLSIDYPDIQALNNKSKLLSTLLGGQYSKRSSLYYGSFNKHIQLELEKIALLIKPKLEKICGKKLKLANSDFRCILLRYEGKDSNFRWHYDTEPKNCYRTLCLIKANGIIPPFVYKDKYQKDKKIILSVGDGILFKGTQTYHKVEESGDPNTVRWMLGFQYVAGKYPKKCRSICSELRGANISKLIKIFLPKLIIMIILVQGSNIFFPKLLINLKTYLIVFLIITIISFILPKYTKNIGTGIVSTIYSISVFTFILNCHYFNPLISIGYNSYLLLTEMLLPSQIISKTLINGGA